VSEIDETAFHLPAELAEVIGRDPAGQGRFGAGQMAPTPGRAQPDRAADQVADQAPAPPAAAPDGELRELPRGMKTDGIVIYVPEKAGVLIGQLMIDAQGQALPLNITDPGGGPWVDGSSNSRVWQKIQAYLDTAAEGLEFTNPVEGQRFIVTRYCLERLLMVATARLEIKEPPLPASTPGGIPVVRGGVDPRALRL
jgi:hypothetical protein